jgi:prophage regulatory protein
MTNDQSGGFIRQRKLLERIPISKTTLWDWVKRGQFPAPVKLGEGVTAWPVEAVDRWEAAIRSLPPSPVGNSR